MPEEERDRIKNPSINFPRSADEAAQAILHSVRRALLDGGTYLGGVALLTQTYTTDAGLGQTRTQQQADWLNEQQSLIRAMAEDFLDRLDLEQRRDVTV
jgi:hypothetical protein